MIPKWKTHRFGTKNSTSATPRLFVAGKNVELYYLITKTLIYDETSIMEKGSHDAASIVDFILHDGAAQRERQRHR